MNKQEIDHWNRGSILIYRICIHTYSVVIQEKTLLSSLEFLIVPETKEVTNYFNKYVWQKILRRVHQSYQSYKKVCK